MKERSNFWLITWSLFTLGNAAGIGWAIARSEMPHAYTHVGLMILGAFLVWLVDDGSGRQEVKTLPAADERLAQLQQSIDAVAVEVERMGEKQRFVEKQAIAREEPRR